MKILLAGLLFFFATSAFAQNAPAHTETAAAPGCGDPKIKFDVSTNRSQHPFAKPDPGKALIYFLQDETNFLSRPRPTTRFGLNGSWIGATQSDAYFYFSVDPGEHHLCADWQSFVSVNTSQTSAAAHFTAEEGGVYFFIVYNHAGNYQGPAGMKFLPLDSDEAQLLMSKFGFSTSHPKK